MIEQEEQYVKTIKKNAKKIKQWLDENDDKPGKTGKPVKSNITDNESAKIKTSKGVIQGYNGVTVVDDKHQVIVHAEAFGKAQEHDLLKPMIEGARENFREIDSGEDVMEKAKLVADSGFHKEDNIKMIMEEGIDGYIADPHFRKRDPRFAEADRYKEQTRKERQKREGIKGVYASDKFTVADDLSHCICPAGKRMHCNGRNIIQNGKWTARFKGNKTSCIPCSLREECLRTPETTEVRTLAYFKGTRKDGKETYTRKMKRKIDSLKGRLIYNRRLGISEPPFAHIRSIMRLDRFSLRGKTKVNAQWLLYCIVHNLTKVHRYGEGLA